MGKFAGAFKVIAITMLGLILTFCHRDQRLMQEIAGEIPGIQANLVFFYYPDLNEAERFYANLLGFEKVLDYGFARILRMSPSTFIGLVDETQGMHDPSEPKSVTLSFVTNTVDQWYQYLEDAGVPMHRPLNNSSRIPIRGFVALDPAGYFLEFETFLEHSQNALLHEHLAPAQTLYPYPGQETTRPGDCGILANIIWLYFKDIPEAQEFYENTFGFNLCVDQGFAKVYASSSTGLIGLVDESKGLHRFAPAKAVNVCYLTDRIHDWYLRFQEKNAHIRDEVKKMERIPVETFIALDPGGYVIEFDHFLKDPKNQRIRELLR